MKNVKTLSSFSNSVIQKGEMKKVFGGFNCPTPRRCDKH